MGYTASKFPCRFALDKIGSIYLYCKFQVSDLEKKLSSAYNQIEQLSHALSDRGAQLDIERNSNMVRKFCCFSVLS